MTDNWFQEQAAAARSEAAERRLGCDDRHPDHPGYPGLKAAMQTTGVTANSIAEAARITRIPSVYDKINGRKGKFTYYEMARIWRSCFQEYTLHELFDITQDDLARIREESQQMSNTLFIFEHHHGLD